MPCAARHASLPIALLTLLLTTFAAADSSLPADYQPLRIADLQRCGDLLEQNERTFCVRVNGLEPAVRFAAQLNGRAIPGRAVETADPGLLRLTLDPRQWQSGPLHLTQGDRISNGVWLTFGSSQVAAAPAERVVRNDDGLATYLDLVSILVEEQHEGAEEARRLAQKYGATVVGAIPPLNIYQLRLPVGDLTERDALVLRLGSETVVDAVIVEESGPEPSLARGTPPPTPGTGPAPDKTAQSTPEQTPGKQTQPHAALPRDASAEEWAANRFHDAVHIYRQLAAARGEEGSTLTPIRIGVVERNVDFDTPSFGDQLGDCSPRRQRTCTWARDAQEPDGHGTTVSSIFAASWQPGGNRGLLAAFDGSGPGFELIVDRNSDAGITANVAASVNLVEDGARILNWSWGLHRLGATRVSGDEVDSLVRSGIAMSGYEELLEEFFRWLRAEHPDVVVVNSAGNGSSFSGRDDYRIPSAFVTDQLLVVGGHQLAVGPLRAVADPGYAVKRSSSNIDRRVDITAAACTNAAVPGNDDRENDSRGEVHCGTSYATPLVGATLAAMLSLNPELTPAQLRILLRRSALPIGSDSDLEAVDAEDLTAPILPSERNNDLNHPELGYSARLDMGKAIELAEQSRHRAR